MTALTPQQSLRTLLHELCPTIMAIDHMIEELQELLDLPLSAVPPSDAGALATSSLTPQSLSLLRALAAQVRVASMVCGNAKSHFCGTPYKTVRIDDIDVWRIVRECVSVCELCCDRADIAFAVELAGDGWMRGSDTDIRRAFMNLLDNAVKYSFRASTSDERRHVDVIGRKWMGTGISVRISNYGVGVLPDERDVLARVGKRGRLAQLDQRGGMGIGFHEVSKIARIHKGDVAIESTLEAQGVTVDALLEMLNANPKAALRLPWRTDVTIRMAGL